MNIFSTREIATAAWLTVILIWVISYKPTRAILPDLIRAALKAKIVAAVLVAVLVTTAAVVILRRISLWTTAELKDTIVWFLFTGIALTFRGVNTPNPNKAIHAIARDAVKATVLVEFVLSTYTFPLIAELLLLPLATLLACLLVVANAEKQYASAASFLNKIQVCVGLTVIAATVWSFSHHLREVWSAESARQLLVPILLTLVFVPVAYFMALISAYEELFLAFKIHQTPFLIRLYAKTRLIIRLRFSLKRTYIARRRLWGAIGKISTKADADRELALLSTEIPAPLPLDVEIAAYQAGYAAGFTSASVRGDARSAVHRQSDSEVADHGYDPDSFDQGFVAGTQDADLQV